MRIFISVAAYNDPELLRTIIDAYDKAEEAGKLRFGILDQCRDDRYDDLPAWREQISYLWMKDRDARGVGFARATIQGMMEDEEYLLQIDSHMRFDEGWDSIMKSQLNELPWKSLLTASPMPWSPDEGKKPLPEGKTIKLYQHPKYPLRNEARLVNTGRRYGHRKGDRLAAGCLFSRGCLYDHVPYDPHIYFNGEEYIYAQRIMSAGWQIYHPRILPIYHLYKKVEYSDPQLLHWGRSTNRYWDPATLRLKGEQRIAKVFECSAGCFSAPTPAKWMHTTSDTGIREHIDSERISSESLDELRRLQSALAPILSGKHHEVRSGSYSAFTHRVEHLDREYFIKSSTDKTHNEKTVDHLLQNKSICSQGRTYRVASPILCISTGSQYYTVAPFIHHKSLRGSSYRNFFSRLDIAHAIGEMNSANMDRTILPGLTTKEFELRLTMNRIKRRFPDKRAEDLEIYLDRAGKVIHEITRRVREDRDIMYSLAHNDLHRQNIGILEKSGASSPLVFFDWAKACWAPIGNDLQFIVHYLVQGKASRESWMEIFGSYMQGLIAGGGGKTFNSRNILEGCILAYADKWLNIHRRPESSSDWQHFAQCLEVSEKFLSLKPSESLEVVVSEITRSMSPFGDNTRSRM